jgi:hypothetical protein
MTDPVNRRTVRQRKSNECLIVRSMSQNVPIARIVLQQLFRQRHIGVLVVLQF